MFCYFILDFIVYFFVYYNGILEGDFSVYNLDRLVQWNFWEVGMELVNVLMVLLVVDLFDLVD